MPETSILIPMKINETIIIDGVISYSYFGTKCSNLGPKRENITLKEDSKNFGRHIEISENFSASLTVNVFLICSERSILHLVNQLFTNTKLLNAII